MDAIKANFMMSDVLLEENDRIVISGSVNVMDNDKSSLAFMAQMTPAIAKKMSTLFQVTFAVSPLAINYLWHCYIFKGTSTCIESLAKIIFLDM
jgi:hypothetical protein